MGIKAASSRWAIFAAFAGFGIAMMMAGAGSLRAESDDAAIRFDDRMPDVRWIAPTDGTIWRAGETALLAWEPAQGVNPSGVEEWEVFLSLDGGRSYPVRLTPHLSSDLHQVSFRVPEVPTRDGRLLLRVGDERVEHSLELPLRLDILDSGRHSVPTALRSARPGESPKPGEPGVILWAEGHRSGSGWQEVESAAPDLHATGQDLADSPAPRPTATLPERDEIAQSNQPLEGARFLCPVAAQSGAAAPQPSRPRNEILGLVHRLNE